MKPIWMLYVPDVRTWRNHGYVLALVVECSSYSQSRGAVIELVWIVQGHYINKNVLRLINQAERLNKYYGRFKKSWKKKRILLVLGFIGRNLKIQAFANTLIFHLQDNAVLVHLVTIHENIISMHGKGNCHGAQQYYNHFTRTFIHYWIEFSSSSQ